MVGTADLTPSVNMTWKDKVDFQHPDLKTACGINGNYAGRYIHWGIREHAMAAISNGLAAYNKGTIFPVTSSFFMFYIYAAPGIRMGALQGLQQIHIATHDSIGTGEDGPTHQPIALAALYRSMPNLLYIRPCDSEETAGAFIAAIKADTTPSIISLSRQALTQYPENSNRDGVQKGAYVFMEQENADVTLIGVGSEMFCAVETKKLLEEGFAADAIHGGKTLGQRKRALERFKRSDTTILVATDVAARGIDVADISHVINYAQPGTYEDYVHRIGRAGRAGKTGFAFTFVERLTS